MLRKVLGFVFSFVLLVGLVALPAEARTTREERDAAREARRVAREEARAERLTKRDLRRQTDQGDSSETSTETNNVSAESVPCSCSARLSFARADLQWRNGTLVLIPRVDVSVRTRGEHSDDTWQANLVYSGETSFSSEDVTVPVGATFAGTKEITRGQCGSNNHSYSGISLEPISLVGVVRGLVGLDEELEGLVRMRAHVEGCEFEEEYRQMEFELADGSNVDTDRWGRVR